MEQRGHQDKCRELVEPAKQRGRRDGGGEKEAVYKVMFMGRKTAFTNFAASAAKGHGGDHAAASHTFIHYLEIMQIHLFTTRVIRREALLLKSILSYNHSCWFFVGFF